MIYTKDTLLKYLDGWAFLHHKRLGDVAVNSLPWKKKAIQDAAGRIAIRTTDAGGKSTVVWLDNVQDKFTTQTLVMSKSNNLVFHSFEYNKLDSLLTMRSLAPSCPMLPTVFWDLRNIKAAINIDYGGPDLHNEWVARNYKSLKGIFEGLGYPCYKGHFSAARRVGRLSGADRGYHRQREQSLRIKGSLSSDRIVWRSFAALLLPLCTACYIGTSGCLLRRQGTVQ